MKERSYAVESGPGQKRLTLGPPRGTAEAAGQTSLAAAAPQQRPSPDAAGLSKLHTVTETPSPVTLTYYEGGSLVDIQGPRRSVIGSDKPSMKRREIFDWSPASRRRLKEMMGKLRREAMDNGLLVTLTYPKDCPAVEEFRVYKNHLRVFLQALCRRFPESSGFWKQEFQRRGAVHFHIILLGASRETLESLRAWITAKWYAIAHKGDKYLGKAACQVDKIKNAGGAMSYMAKYISKGDQTRPSYNVGRYWGIFGRPSLPYGTCKTLKLSPEQITRVRRWGRRKIEADVNHSRWRNFFDNRNPRKPAPGDSGVCKDPWALGSRTFWAHAKSCFHGGARSIYSLRWQGKYEMDGLTSVEGWRESWTSPSIIKDYRPPSKWKARCNDRVRVFCDASAFVLCLQRALDAGIL